MNHVREVYLFGSVARGDYDIYSDIDILIVVDDCSEEEYIKWKDCFAELLNMPVSWISLYRISKILKMYNIGSYFLWHIKKEGKMIFSRENELASLLDTLPPYMKVHDDLQEYTEILKDIISELDNTYISIDYELAVMASLVRNTCIAIAYMNDNMDFGRNSVVMYCFDKYGIKVDLQEYKNLYQYRLYHTGKISNVQNGNISQLKRWIEIERELLKIAKKGVKNYEEEFVSRVE